MEKIFNLTSSFKALEEGEDGSVMIRGMASTDHQDRANDVIRAEAWDKGGLDNFKNNPIILFNHNYDKPIGRATGLKVTPNGLELEAKISKSAPDSVAQLIKEGILGAFSVGFRVKDADYIKETDGLMIKDAELFEVSVVSVPCNQAATFSVAKSFNSMKEYEEFKKTFVNSVDETSEEVNTSVEVNETRDEQKAQNKETKMSEENKIDLEAFAKKVADETAAKIAMKQAQEKAAAEAEAKKLAEAEEAEAKVKSTIEFGIQSGTERLLSDVEAKLAEKDAKIDEVIKTFQAQLEEKSAEIAKMNESKRVFADRKSGKIDLGKDLMYAHVYGVITGKGMNTTYAQDIFQKAGVDISDAATYDDDISTALEQEIRSELMVATLFREIQVNAQNTTFPIQHDVSLAQWANNNYTNGVANANIKSSNAGANTVSPSEVVLTAKRLLSQTFLNDEVDEAVLLNLMPMMVDAIARSHARQVENTFINGNADHINGLITDAGATTLVANNAAVTGAVNTLTAADLLAARATMGLYGRKPADVVYIVSQDGYYDLLQDPEFQNLNEVGSDLAAKVTGTMGAVYGSNVIVSDEMTGGAGEVVGLAVNSRNFVIPRLRGVTVERDREVAFQRDLIVATQSLGFKALIAGAGVKSVSKA
jgi:HK97 family phage prohead protease